jgi:hypothetical protein
LHVVDADDPEPRLPVCLAHPTRLRRGNRPRPHNSPVSEPGSESEERHREQIPQPDSEPRSEIHELSADILTADLPVFHRPDRLEVAERLLDTVGRYADEQLLCALRRGGLDVAAEAARHEGRVLERRSESFAPG